MGYTIVENLGNTEDVVVYPTLTGRPTAAAYGDGQIRIDSTVYVSDSVSWQYRAVDGVHYTFATRPGYVTVGGSIMALGNLSYTPTISAVIDESTAVFVLTGNKVVKGSNIWAQGANQAEFNGVLPVLSVSGNNVTVQLASPATATAATGTLGALEMENITDVNFIHLGNCIKKQRALYLGNFAQSGSQTSSHITQLAAALLPANNRFGVVPRIAFIGSPGNDILADVAVATIIANLETMIAMCKAAGTLPVLTTLPPISTAYGGYSHARAAAGRYVNKWIEDQCAQGMIERINVHADWVNKADAGGGWITGYTADGIHPTSIAAYAAANSSVAAFFDRIHYDALGYTVTELWTNYELTGTGGTVTGTGGSGTTADTTTVTSSGGGSQTVVASKVATYGESLGEAIKLVVTGVASLDAGTVSFTGSQHALLTAGDLIIISARIRNHDSAIDADFKFLNANAALTIDTIAHSAVSSIVAGAASVGFGTGYWDLLLEFPAFEVPASGLTAFNIILQMAFGAAGATTDTFSDISIKKITL